ncbi:hypothetical protein P7C73_g2447, partial [Tremellales sp. Uapishka_1]
MTIAPTTTTAGAFLFDMDGTLLDSTPAVLATWQFFAEKYNLDLSEVLRTSHGVRTIDNMRNWCGLTTQSELEEATELFESMIVSEAKRLQDSGERGLEVLPGVQDLISVAPLLDSIYIRILNTVTATTTYASAALPTAGIRQPPQLITANHVTKGKPHPEPYLTGAAKIGYDIKDCIVVEDAPSGILSGVASGARVLAVCTSHDRNEVEGLGATWVVKDLSKIKATLKDGRIALVIDEQ